MTTRQKTAQIEERRDEVMRLMLGGANHQIVRQTGISHGTVQRDINARLEGAAVQCPDTTQYRQLQRERLNQMLVKLWPLAMAKVPDLSAIAIILKLLGREAKLLGLDAAPEMVEHTGSEGKDITVTYVLPDGKTVEDYDDEAVAMERILPRRVEPVDLPLMPRLGRSEAVDPGD